MPQGPLATSTTKFFRSSSWLRLTSSIERQFAPARTHGSARRRGLSGVRDQLANLGGVLAGWGFLCAPLLVAQCEKSQGGSGDRVRPHLTYRRSRHCVKRRQCEHRTSNVEL